MYKNSPAPDGDRHFNGQWGPTLPPSPAEIALAELRQIHGNVEGTRIFRDEQRTKKAAWF